MVFLLPPPRIGMGPERWFLPVRRLPASLSARRPSRAPARSHSRSRTLLPIHSTTQHVRLGLLSFASKPPQPVKPRTPPSPPPKTTTRTTAPRRRFDGTCLDPPLSTPESPLSAPMTRSRSALALSQSPSPRSSIKNRPQEGRSHLPEACPACPRHRLSESLMPMSSLPDVVLILDTQFRYRFRQQKSISDSDLWSPGVSPRLKSSSLVYQFTSSVMRHGLSAVVHILSARPEIVSLRSPTISPARFPTIIDFHASFLPPELSVPITRNVPFRCAVRVHFRVCLSTCPLPRTSFLNFPTSRVLKLY